MFCVLQELEFQQKKKERIHGDKFVESMGSFVKVAQFSLSELDETWKEMKQKVLLSSISFTPTSLSC